MENTTIYAPGKLYPVFAVSFPLSRTGWMAGLLGHIWITRDRGKTWAIQDVPVRKALSDICFVDDKTGWAVGYGGTILHTSDMGKVWSTQASSLKNYWKAVWFKDRKHGWIVGERGTIIKTDDGGLSWHIEISGDDVILNSIAFSPEGNGWAVGEFGVVYSKRNGKKWTLEDNGIASDQNTLWSVCYTENGVAAASGIASTVIITDRKGERWHPSTGIREKYGQHSLFRILYFKNRIITFGQQVIFYSDDMGKTWKAGKMETPIPIGECLYDFSCDKDRVVIAGTKGILLGSLDGITWTNLR